MIKTKVFTQLLLCGVLCIPQIGRTAAPIINGAQQPSSLFDKTPNLQLNEETPPKLGSKSKEEMDQVSQKNAFLLQFHPLQHPTQPLFEGNFLSAGADSMVRTKVYLWGVRKAHYALNFEGNGLFYFSCPLPVQTATTSPQKPPQVMRALGYAQLNERAKNYVLKHAINLSGSSEANFVILSAEGIILTTKENAQKDLIQVSKKPLI